DGWFAICGGVVVRGGWQSKDEGAPFAVFARRPQLPAVSLDDALGDVQAKADASAGRLDDLPKAFEDDVELLRFDALARVDDGKLYLALDRLDQDVDRSTSRCKLYSITHDVG